MWLLPAALFLAFCCLSSAGAQVTLTEEEFTKLSENLTRLEEINETQAKELDEQEITLKQLQAQVVILQTASNALTNQLNVSAQALMRADASLTRAGTYLQEQDAAHKRRTFLTGLTNAVVFGLVGFFGGATVVTVWG